MVPPRRCRAVSIKKRLGCRGSRLMVVLDAQLAEAAVHVDDFAGHAVGELGGQEHGGTAHIGGGHVAAQGSVLFHAGKDVLQTGDGGSGQGLDGAGAQGIDAHALFAQVVGQVAHGSFQSGLGHAHDVVAGDDLGGTVVGHGQHRRTVMQQGLESAADAGEGVGGDVQGQMETGARRIQEAAAQVFTVGKGHGVDQDVHLAPLFLDQVGGGLDLGVVGHVTLEGELASQFFAQGLNTLFDGVAHIVESKAGALFLEGIGDAVSDALVVGQAQDQGFFSLKQHVISSRKVALATVTTG